MKQTPEQTYRLKIDMMESLPKYFKKDNQKARNTPVRFELKTSHKNVIKLHQKVNLVDRTKQIIFYNYVKIMSSIDLFSNNFNLTVMDDLPRYSFNDGFLVND